MRIAVVTDIHGNLSALEAVVADLQNVAPDIVVHGGDLVAGGYRGDLVLDRVRDLGWPGLQGNTDEMLWKPEMYDQFMSTVPQLAHIWHLVFKLQAPATLALIGSDRLAWLQQLPTLWRHDELTVVHAALDNLWRAPMATATDAELRAAYGPANACMVAYGHIHTPFVRTMGEMTVANCGSVGMPFDGDRRASYLVVDSGAASIRRVEYDVDAEVRGLLDSGYPDAERIAETLRSARYVLPPA